MDFSLTAEQEQLREVARRFLGDHYPPDRVAAAADAGGDPGAWSALARLGWCDTGLIERSVLAEECGYALLPAPWWSALALAVPPERPVAIADGVFTAEAGPGADGTERWRVTGSAAGVPDVLAVDAVLVSDRVRTFEVAVSACTLTPVDGVDPLRAGADLVCSGAPALERPPVQDRRISVLLAAEAVGVARRALDFAVEHAKVREQFGRPIGSYQGVAFPLADCLVVTETARSLVYRAAWLVSEEDDRDRVGVAMALPAARQAAITACEQAIQTLGGLGMTWEHPLHHWYRRALWLQAYGVADEECFERVAAALL
ncbi:acyl-CoA dehydrogenase family protein [Plantactinospora sp. WMMC1484]|uniref:acyl-CoA dehydrogenase family protein n=1 Tax=Plantactinospora sp. WMMC1484 TaxID=3404122 RepID=UPI003BF49379